MQVSVTGQGMEVGAALKDNVHERLEKFQTLMHIIFQCSTNFHNSEQDF